MKIGVVFPQTEIGNDPAAIRDYAQAVEGMGYTHLLAYDHVLGANPNRPGGWTGPYTYQTPFHEVFVLFGYLAGLTQNLGLVTGILILPQRQTVLAAKQAASLDVLSGGRVRLGMGLGWNEVEYTALNENFHNRGRRIEEQVMLMRRLWTEELVTFESKYHHIPDAGLNPLPVQRPIPVWFGGRAEPVLRRVAKMGDGWMPNEKTVADARPYLEQLDRFLAEEGRTRADLGIEARMPYGIGGEAAWRQWYEAWQAEGATHASINTMGNGFTSPDEHIQALRRAAEVLVKA